MGIALLLLCDRIGLDPIEAMQDKLAANRRKYPVETSRGRAEKADPDGRLVGRLTIPATGDPAQQKTGPPIRRSARRYW